MPEANPQQDLMNWFKSVQKFTAADLRKIEKTLEKIRSEGWSEGYHEGRSDAEGDF